MVSAPAVAKERGITVSESRQDTSPVYDSLIRITVTTEMGRRSFAGTVIAGAPRIVEVKGMEVAAGEDAIALVGVDEPPDQALLAQIKALPHVKEARALRF
jgi:D-3-phosphoglycerate dehydrogenase